jgi:hypothetical protein
MNDMTRAECRRPKDPCRICGDMRDTEYISRCLMTLCPSCHSDMPPNGRKASYSEFLSLTFKQDDRTAREFYSDYKASRIFDVSEYWEGCSR